MDLFCFTELSAVLALCHWTTLFLDFKEGTVSMLACRGSVAFDAGLAEGRAESAVDDDEEDTHQAYFLLSIKTYDG